MPPLLAHLRLVLGAGGPLLLALVVTAVGVLVAVSMWRRRSARARRPDGRGDGALADTQARTDLVGPRGDAPVEDQMEALERLRQAIATGELRTWFQPQLNLRTGRVHSVEALVRWDHPERGLLTPEAFLPLAESTDLIGQLTAVVLEDAAAACAGWRRVGMRIRVSVNLSAKDAMNPALPDMVEGTLRRHGLPPQALTLELTETAVLSDLPTARRVLQAIDQIGVEISLDDFGTGYASLSTLRGMPITELKIDRSFVAGVTGGGPDVDVVRFTIELGQRLHLRVVAEGLESAAQVTAVGGLGCQVVQGFHVGRPMSWEDMTNWLGRRTAHGEGPPLLVDLGD